MKVKCAKCGNVEEITPPPQPPCPAMWRPSLKAMINEMLPTCPECGATNSYKQLASKAKRCTVHQNTVEEEGEALKRALPRST